ncbi:MAG: hypothetical protein J6R13_05820 [Alistipes sp.]|nr:hypothetical protein [Alistipes sp.]
MVNNLTVGASVWVMYNNKPTNAVVAKITTTETSNGKTVVVGVGTPGTNVLSPFADYAPGDLYISRKSLQIALFGENE